MDTRALAAGITATSAVALGVGLGSRNLMNYDPALLIYTFGSLLSAYVITYRVTVFYQRPPTRRYLSRGLEFLFRGATWRTVYNAAGGTADKLAAQRFILRRDRMRWLSHFLFSWGTLIACAVTFPLVFGWIHFETLADDPKTYQVMLFGNPVDSFTLGGLKSFLVFNALNIAAVMVIAGVCMALHRRLYAPGRSRARQQFGRDLVPLIMLLSISVTGLMLTFSTHAMDGYGHAELSLIHALTVIVTLMYVPFGKFFHIFVRPLHVVIGVYRGVDAAQPPALCGVCGGAYAGQMHVSDLKRVLEEVGLDWPLDGAVAHFAEVCPRCRRRLMGANHGKIAGRQPGSGAVWQD